MDQRAEWNLVMQSELRAVLSKHERERRAVVERDAIAEEVKVCGASQARLDEKQIALTNAADQLDMAIYSFVDRLFDLAKGEEAQ